MKRETKLLYRRAVDSLVMGVDHFNRCWDRGRTEAVLIFLDRAFELVLKAIIVERGGRIREKNDTSLTIGFDSCLRQCISVEKLKCLSEEDGIAAFSQPAPSICAQRRQRVAFGLTRYLTHMSCTGMEI